jgi:21S rRNA (uridine2791-2'-O)-methyltransferase
MCMFELQTQLQYFSMLSRRVFRELTDRILLGVSYRPIAASCVATRCWVREQPPIGRSTRNASSSSSTRWKSRQGKDFFAREARVQGLKSRAAFKLLEVHVLKCQ